MADAAAAADARGAQDEEEEPRADLSSLPPVLLADVLQRLPLMQRMGFPAQASSLLRQAVAATIGDVTCAVLDNTPATKQPSLLAWLAAHGQHVTALQLQLSNEAGGELQGLTACTALRELRLRALSEQGAAPSNPAAEVLLAPGAVSGLRGLTALALDPCGAGSLAHLSTLTALQELALVGPSTQHLAQLTGSLSISRHPSGSGLQLTQPGELSALPLRYVSLQRVSSLDAAVLAGLSQLLVLELDCEEVSNSNGAALADSADSLTRLVLGRMPAAGWAALFSAEHPLLRLQSLRTTRQPKAASLALVPAAAPALRKLWMTGANGVPQCFTQLLGLTGLHAERASAECLSELVPLRHLRRLFVSSTCQDLGDHSRLLALTAMTGLTALHITALGYFDGDERAFDINLQAGGGGQEAAAEPGSDSDSDDGAPVAGARKPVGSGRVKFTGRTPVNVALKKELDALDVLDDDEADEAEDEAEDDLGVWGDDAFTESEDGYF